ncbi:MAG: hypothetical protein OEV93_00330 [Candidatus Moranbacteria bacterium]|nr:hypothetical protein [Candidatus Moranbacteria bacterium]
MQKAFRLESFLFLGTILVVGLKNLLVILTREKSSLNQKIFIRENHIFSFKLLLRTQDNFKKVVLGS